MRICIAVVSLVMMASPALAKDPPLLGAWELAAAEENGKRMAPPPGLQVLFEFKKGGRLVQTRIVNGVKTPVDGRWEAQGTTLSMVLGRREVMTFAVEGAVLTLSKPEQDAKMLLQRPGSKVIKVTAADQQAARDSLERYQRRAKATEATVLLKTLQVGARAYYSADHYSSAGKLLPPSFPAGDTGWVPATPCCKQPKGTCAPDPKTWQSEPWRSLSFQIDDSHRFQYRYRAKGAGKKATVILEARGDLDCNGKFSSYSVTGTVGASAEPVFGSPVVVDPLE